MANPNRKSSIVLAALLFGACAAPPAEDLGVETSAINAIDLCPASVPAALVPLPGQQLKAAYHAEGLQTYVCQQSGTTFTWVNAPRANLYDTNGRVVGTHFAGPTWQFHDGSSVRGQKLVGVTVDPSAVPWLLLRGIAWTDSPDGDGRFADITYVQRLDTSGGVGPAASACDAGHVNTEVDVPYSADYFFYHAGDNDSRRCQ